jgi:predicted nucleic acid-binding Zn ribbon protein
MKSRAPRPLGELLVSALPQLEDRLLVQRMRRAWSAAVGADLARRAQPQALVNGCLTIVVDNSPWLHELTLRAAELTARLHAQFPAVQTLRFSLGAAAADEAAAPPAARAAARPRLTDDDTRAIDAAAAAIPDPALAASARRLLARAWPPVPAPGKERGKER